MGTMTAPCKHDPLAQRTSVYCIDCAREADKNTLASIGALQMATAVLDKRVKELEEFNASLRQPAQSVIAAARGIAPGKGDTASLIEMRKFIMDILDPEMYGYAVSREVRNAARRVLGIDAKE